MSRLISDILAAPEPHFTYNLREWERLSGNPSHDIRLVTDIKHRVKRVMKQLTLDESDTKPQELYYALIHQAASDNKSLEKHIGISDEDSPDKMLKAIIKYVLSLESSAEVWVLKPTFLKQQLKIKPPKKLMKILGLRSLDSALKRLNISELLVMANALESPDWKLKFWMTYKKAKSSDFQLTKRQIIVLSQAYQKKIFGEKKPIFMTMPLYEAGQVIVTTPAKRYNGDVLHITLTLLHSINELRSYSTYFRLISMRKDFGERFMNVIQKGLPTTFVKSIGIHGSLLVNHLASSTDAFSKLGQPHLDASDIVNPRPLEALSDDLPKFIFWRDHDYIFYHSDEDPVSCHLTDIAINLSNDIKFGEGSLGYMRNRLWEELLRKYLKNHVMEEQAIKEFLK